jgi:GTPase SAR1 family protein
MNRLFDVIGPKKKEKTFLLKLTDSFASFRSLVPLGASPTSRLFARVPPSTFILLVGLDGCGKSTLLRKYLVAHSESVQTVTPTIGINLEELQVGPAFYQATDIGGCRPAMFRRFDEELFKRADAVIYMVDAADRDRVMEAREEFIMCGLRANNGGMRRGVPLLVLATKIDLKVGGNTLG